MISPLITKAFLARELRDSNLAKSLSEKAIDRRISALPVQPHWKTPPRYLHQKVSFLLAARRKRYLLLLGMGLGKSWVSLAVLQYAFRLYYRGLSEIKPRTLILVPGSSNLGQWEDECRKHTRLSCQGIDAVGSANRMIQVLGDADVVVITYAGFLGLVCSGKTKLDENNEPEIDPKTGEYKTKGWKIDPKKLKVFQKRFNFLILDESTQVRNHRSLSAKACKKLSWGCDRVLALTGTPHGKDPIDLWSQFNIVDKGATLGETLGLFREALFVKKPDYWRGFVYEFDQRKKAILNRMIRNASIRYTDEEASDLPPAVSIIRPIKFPAENFAYYSKLWDELKAAQGNYEDVQISFHRLRQIAFGYISTKSGNGDQIDIRFKENPKLDQLLLLLDEIPADRKVVVWNEYKITGDIIEEAFRKKKIKYIRLFSGTPNKIKKNIAERFTNSKTRVLLSSSAGAYGGNFQVSSHCIWVERPADPLIWKQEAKRCHRIGQLKKVFLYDLVILGSVDERIIKAHEAGVDLFRATIDGKGLLRGLKR
jgi:SNF2 family DNA or RNA helicase